MLATDPPEGGATALSATPVEGKACFNPIKMTVFVGDDVFEDAVRNALQSQPGANILLNATFTDDGDCVRVQGIPGRL